MRCASARLAQEKYVPKVFKTATKSETAPSPLEEDAGFPLKSVLEPTLRKPVTLDKTITGKSMKVRR